MKEFPIKIVGIKVVDVVINVILFFAGLVAIGFAVGVIFGFWEKLI
jgi:hypothetical protein